MNNEQAWISLAISASVLLILFICTYRSRSTEPEDYLVVTIQPSFVCDPCAKAPHDHKPDLCKGGHYCDCQHKGQVPEEETAQAA